MKGPIRTALALVALALPATFTAAPGAAPAKRAPTTRAAATPSLASSRAMLARLEASGRAIASFQHSQPDPFGDGAREQRGTLAIEPPDRTRLDFASGESVTLRSEGGEWLQPELGQMLRLGAGQVEAARRWWSLLLPGAASRFTEKNLAKNRFLVIARGDGAADSAWVTLGADALPSGLRFRGVDGEFVEIRFTQWKFSKARGRAAFVLEPPAGIDVIELP